MFKSFTLNFLPFEYFETVNLMGKLHGNMDDKLAQSNLDVEDVDRFNNIMLSASDFVYACVVCDMYKNDDHTIFIADVVKIHVNEKQSGSPMLFSGRGRYASLADTTIANDRLYHAYSL